MTLVELLIVVVIVGILATIAVPSYRNYVMKANRQDGIDLLTTCQYRVQSYLFQFNKSASDILTQVGCDTLLTPEGSKPVKYVVSSTDLSGSYVLTDAYTLKATPSAEQAKDGTLLLTYEPGTRKLTKKHIAPGTTVELDGWDFQPGR